MALEHIQVTLHVTGQVVGVEAAFVTVGKHLLGAVIASHDNPAAAVDVKHVEGVAFHTRCLGVGQFEVRSSTAVESSSLVLHKKLGSCSAGSFSVNIAAGSVKRHQAHGCQQG